MTHGVMDLRGTLKDSINKLQRMDKKEHDHSRTEHIKPLVRRWEDRTAYLSFDPMCTMMIALSWAITINNQEGYGGRENKVNYGKVEGSDGTVCVCVTETPVRVGRLQY